MKSRQATPTTMNLSPHDAVQQIISLPNCSLSTGPTQLVLIQPINTSDNAKKPSKVFTVLGVFEILVGLVSIVCGIIAITLDSMYYSVYTWDAVATGIWCGVFFILAGMLGVISGRTCNTCPVIGGMVLSIFAALAGAALLALSIPAAVTIQSIESPGQVENSSLACHIILSTCGSIALITSIVHSSYCCSITCCSQVKTKGTTAYYTPVQLFPQQEIGNANHPQVQAQQPTTVGPPPKYESPTQNAHT